jgi:hypothetical protein
MSVSILDVILSEAFDSCFMAYLYARALCVVKNYNTLKYDTVMEKMDAYGEAGDSPLVRSISG